MTERDAGASGTTLLILTNDYPFRGGDGAFVKPELPALLDSFDRVFVANYSRRSAPLEELPDGVQYLGNLFGQSRRAKLAAVLRPSNLSVMARNLGRERRAGRGAWRSQLTAAIVGMTVAGHPALRSLVSEDRGTVTVYAFWGMGAALSLPWLRRDAAGTVLRLHRYDLFEDASDSGLPLRASLFDSADLILSISEQGKRYLTSRFGALVSSKTVVRRLGTHDSGVGPRPHGGVATVVSCSSLTAVKRVDRIFEALRLVATADRPLRWVHFGGGILDEDLRRLVADTPHPFLDVELRGHTSNDEVLAFYRENPVRVFVNASESEGVPVSIMEAMSFDVPVVATDVGGTGEIVGPDLGSGMLVEVDAGPGTFAQAIGTVLDAAQGSFRPREVWHELSDAEVNALLTAEAVRSVSAYPRGRTDAIR